MQKEFWERTENGKTTEHQYAYGNIASRDNFLRDLSDKVRNTKPDSNQEEGNSPSTVNMSKV